MSPFWSVIIGVVAAGGVTALTAILTRRKMRAETSHLDADAADVLSQGVSRIIPYYESRITGLETRLSAAEASATSAHAAATAAGAAEALCRVRCEELQTQINELRHQVEHPPVTTTVTTAITTQEKP